MHDCGVQFFKPFFYLMSSDRKQNIREEEIDGKVESSVSSQNAIKSKSFTYPTNGPH